ncbi:Aste57867_21001 [Aphanomyces stellatus]|uniref:Aste57867_21001 protein n=1 Tax=Aphanomyces stellatus TaxID=120398 RepID=A0A485LGJ0_9STRA|nr:hypothetical protein As57867_020933 [Aphanomyces stellatus]VFT97676.1 Aste57867_21001 [Aphanomyces stellatus]
MAFLLTALTTKAAIDEAVLGTKNKVLVLRFGRSCDPVCLQMDDIMARCEPELARQAKICTVDVDLDESEVYCHYFDISLIPATVFFYNGQHMKIDFRTPDYNKFIGAFHCKQDFLDLVEVRRPHAFHDVTISMM